MQKEFDWDKFKNEKIAVHCKTEEEAKDLCQKMHEHGMKWFDGSYYYLSTTCYEEYRTETCYTGRGTFGDCNFYIKRGYTILEWSDYMQKEFTKADLKNGMVVEYRNGKIGIYINGKILYEDGFDVICELTEDLLDADCEDCNKGYDIIKVYELNMSGIYDLKTVLEKKNLILIWERNETKHMTAEEMRVKLEEMTGDKIEIEGNRRIGRWFLLDECSNSGVYCSICGKKVYKEDYANQKIKSKYCPNCGSIMEC